MGPYSSEIDKSIVSYGCAGFLIVDLNPYYREKINDSTIEGMYQKISAHCEQVGGISKVPVVFMWSQDEVLPLPDYGPEAFEEARKNPDFIATRGIMPVIVDDDEKREWSDSVFRLVI